MAKRVSIAANSGSGDYVLMICKDLMKGGKKNSFTGGCKNFQRSALERHTNQVDRKRFWDPRKITGTPI